MRYLLFIPLILLLCAWNWNAHKALAESTFYSLNETTRDTINLKTLKEGSIAPDKEFKDFTAHSPPTSLKKAQDWLDTMSTAHTPADKGYALGVASHYLADSFSAPHAVTGEDYADHDFYEQQASLTYLYTPCTNAPMEELLAKIPERNASWKEWLSTKKNNIPKKHAKEAMQALLTTSTLVFRECSDFITIYEKKNFVEQLTSSQVTLLSITSSVFCITLISLIKEFVEE